jgi:mannose-1-phosphate guanylyltransferase
MLVRVILSGGSGKRLFPLSTDETPKQYLKFYNESKNLLGRVMDCNIGHSQTVIVASSKDESILKSQDFGEDSTKVHILYEEYRRDTSCAIWRACEFINGKWPDARVIVIPSDNIIDQQALIACIANATLCCHKALITFGVVPHHASTLYGYIEKGPAFGLGYMCLSFREKPNEELAHAYVGSGNYLWNSGIYYSSCAYIMSLFKAYSVNYSYLDCPDNRNYKNCKTIAFDIDITEKINYPYNLLVFSYNGTWIDVGNWRSVYEGQGDDVSSTGDIKSLDVRHSLLLNNTDIPVRVIGLDNVVVVLTAKGLLVSKMNVSHKIKELV